MSRFLLPLLLTSSALGQDEPLKAPAPAKDADKGPDLKPLVGTLHKLLLANLPDPLVQTEHNWGHQKEGVIGVRWEKKGLLLRPELMRDTKSDGRWERVTLTAVDPKNTLQLVMANPRSPEPGKTVFDAVVLCDVRLTYEHQLWSMGKRLVSGETRAKCSAGVQMVVEVTSKSETKPGAILPTITLRAKVTQAKVSYWDLECEHALGSDGPVARAAGKAVYDVLKKMRPDAEKALLAKADAAIVKAADSKEVTLELGNLFSGKK
jgi:hypothetical protein